MYWRLVWDIVSDSRNFPADLWAVAWALAQPPDVKVRVSSAKGTMESRGCFMMPDFILFGGEPFVPCFIRNW